MGVITLNKMEFYAYHGCFKEETKVGNYFLVDLEITTDTQKAEQSDCLEDALNYQVLYHLVAAEMDQASKLLEHVGNRILNALYTQFPAEIAKAKVTVHKMNPPLGGKMNSVSVTLER